MDGARGLATGVIACHKKTLATGKDPIVKKRKKTMNSRCQNQKIACLKEAIASNNYRLRLYVGQFVTLFNEESLRHFIRTIFYLHPVEKVRIRNELVHN